MPDDSRDLAEALAAVVRAERARRGWTQAELADALGWGRGKVADVETARRSVTLPDVDALGEVFGMTLEEFAAEVEGSA